MMRLSAPAKLNLYLRVVGKRADGYHELDTLFERIDLADELTFEPHPSQLSLSCSDPTLPCDETNLVLKAARLLADAGGVRYGARIHLNKHIPVAAGLGGGSSDAATTLLGLNRVWKLGYSRERLIELGAQLGSDVPFFIGEAPYAIGRGRGERCEWLREGMPTLWHVLVVPRERLSTKAVYEGLAQSRAKRMTGLTPSAASSTILVHALCNGPALAGLAAAIVNDLEAEAIRRCPIIQEMTRCLRSSGCVGCAVSGSGSAVYALVHDARQAESVAQSVRIDGDPAWLVRVVTTYAASC